MLHSYQTSNPCDLNSSIIECFTTFEVHRTGYRVKSSDDIGVKDTYDRSLHLVSFQVPYRTTLRRPPYGKPVEATLQKL